MGWLNAINLLVGDCHLRLQKIRAIRVIRVKKFATHVPVRVFVIQGVKNE
jgi:hypothetical protein